VCPLDGINGGAAFIVPEKRPKAGSSQSAINPPHALYAVGNGIGSIVKGTLPLSLFGPTRYPVLMGKLALPILCAISLSPYVGALVLQLGSVRATLMLLDGSAATNFALVAILFFLRA
jgi:hypothetical protein